MANKKKTAVEIWNEELKDRKTYDVDGKTRPNKTKMVLIRYESGLIFGKQGYDKTLGVVKRGWRKFWSSNWSYLLTPFRTLNDLTGVIANTGSDNVDTVVGYQDNAGFVDGVFFSEYYASDKSKTGNPPKGDKVIGCYVFPYFKGHGHKSEKRYNKSKEVYEVDTHDLPHHYLYCHCYYNFQIYGEDFAKLYGIEKVTADNVFGFEYQTFFTSYVSWTMTTYIVYGGVKEDLVYTCVLKEDLNPSDGGLAKWLVGAAAKLAVTAATGGASLIGTAVAGASSIASAENTAHSIGEKMAATPYKNKDGTNSDRLYGWKEQDTQRIIDASNKETAEQDKIWNSELKDKAGSLGKSVGSSFSGIGRTFQGGKGSYSSSVKEFIFNKAIHPTLLVQARTGLHYQNFWLAEMNRRIATFDFWFGKDPEISLREGFGMKNGVGYDKEKEETDALGVKRKKGILSGLHGFIQLQDTISFFGQFNPFIDYWIGTDIFIYQLPFSKRPKLEFFKGFQGEVSFVLARGERRRTINIENRTERTTERDVKCSNGLVYCYAWVQGGCSSGNGFVVSGSEKLIGYGNKINKYYGDEAPVSVSDWPTDPKLKGEKYQHVNFSGASVGAEITFGTGSRYCVLGYMKRDPDEEELSETPEPAQTTWVLKMVGSGVYGKNTVSLSQRIRGVDIVTSKIETGTNALNINFKVPIAGSSGIEGFGSNPPNGFNGGGGGGISLPIGMGTSSSISPGMGLSLPESNALNTSLQPPEQITSQLSGQEINLNLASVEMPKMQEQSTSQQEWISGQQTTEGYGEQSGFHSTDRGSTQIGSGKKDQEKKKDK